MAKIPFTGLILGNVAVILIALIAKFSDRKGMILKATVIVLIVKGIISPHTPLTAYLAVSLQGLTGELIFHKRKFPLVSAFLLGVIVSLFSSVQKIFFLTVIFGQNLWESIDRFSSIIFKEFFGYVNPDITVSVWLIVAYASIHIIAGILTGIYSGRLYKNIDYITESNGKINPDELIDTPELNISKQKKSKHKKWWFKPSGIIFFLVVFTLLLYSYLYPEYTGIKKDSLIIMLIRGVLLMFLWYKFLSPVLLSLFKKLINKKRNRYTKEVEDVVNILPLIKSIIYNCWKKSSTGKGLKRLHRFFTLSLLNLLTFETKEK